MTNGNGANADLPADTYNIKITAAGDASTVAFDADVPLAEGTNTIAYAIGSVSGGSFTVATAAITGLAAAAPEGVPTGDAGLATESSMVPVLFGALALIAVGGGAIALRSNRG